MNIESIIRKLARSHYWQTIYFSSKEIDRISLFENNNDFSGLQFYFLNWLRIYSMLYSELAEYTDKKLTEKVIEDDCRCDAYLYYRRKKIEFDWKKHREKERLDSLKAKHHFKNEGNVSLIDVNVGEE